MKDAAKRISMTPKLKDSSHFKLWKGNWLYEFIYLIGGGGVA